MPEKTTKIHFIEEGTDHLLFFKYTSHVPSPGDEIRIGGEGNEKFYKVTRIVWVYDEEDPFERVNVGIEKVEL